MQIYWYRRMSQDKELRRFYELNDDEKKGKCKKKNVKDIRRYRCSEKVEYIAEQLRRDISKFEGNYIEVWL